jgi:integrase
VTRGDVQDLADRLTAQGLSASTVQNTLDPLRVIYRRAIRRDLVAVNPTEGLELRRADGRRDHIATPERTIHVQREWDDLEGEQEGKSAAADRRIPILAPLSRELAAHRLRSGRGGDDLVFGASATVAFLPSTVRRRALNAWKAANDRLRSEAEERGEKVDPAMLLDPIALHEARHTCASVLIASGANPKVIQTVMGHATIGMTFDTYCHLMPGGLEDAAAAADAYLLRDTAR